MESQPEYQLGPPLSLQDGAPGFTIGEYILVRIPGRIQVNGQVTGDEATAGTALPLTSNGSSTQHFAFIRQVAIYAPGSYQLRSTLYSPSLAVTEPLPVTMEWTTPQKQRFSHSHIYHSTTPRPKLSELH